MKNRHITPHLSSTAHQLYKAIANLPARQSFILGWDLRENGLAHSRHLARVMNLTEREVCDLRIEAQAVVQKELGMPWFHITQAIGIDLPDRDLSPEELDAEVRAADDALLSEKNIDDFMEIAQQADNGDHLQPAEPGGPTLDFLASGGGSPCSTR